MHGRGSNLCAPRRSREVWLDDVLPSDKREDIDFQIRRGDGWACTLNFATIDTGLVTSEGVSVRCELLTRTSDPAAARVLNEVARILAQGVFEAQPGTVIAGVAAAAELDFARYSVRHALLISPDMWGGPVPQLQEEGKLTLVLQVVMLTEEEYRSGVIPADASDWRRVG